MTKYWLLTVKCEKGRVLHALREAGSDRPLCRYGRMWVTFRHHGFGMPTCQRCLKMLDEIKAEQAEKDRSNIGLPPQ